MQVRRDRFCAGAPSLSLTNPSHSRLPHPHASRSESTHTETGPVPWSTGGFATRHPGCKQRPGWPQVLWNNRVGDAGADDFLRALDTNLQISKLYLTGNKVSQLRQRARALSPAAPFEFGLLFGVLVGVGPAGIGFVG